MEGRQAQQSTKIIAEPTIRHRRDAEPDELEQSARSGVDEQPTRWSTRTTKQQWKNNIQGAFQQQPNGVPFRNVQNNQGAFQQQPNGPRPLTTNFSYCHTHRYSMSAHHNSATCEDQDPGHQWQSTRKNSMGGSQAGGHRLNM